MNNTVDLVIQSYEFKARPMPLKVSWTTLLEDPVMLFEMTPEDVRQLRMAMVIRQAQTQERKRLEKIEKFMKQVGAW